MAATLTMVHLQESVQFLIYLSAARTLPTCPSHHSVGGAAAPVWRADLR